MAARGTATVMKLIALVGNESAIMPNGSAITTLNFGQNCDGPQVALLSQRGREMLPDCQ